MQLFSSSDRLFPIVTNLNSLLFVLFIFDFFLSFWSMVLVRITSKYSHITLVLRLSPRFIQSLQLSCSWACINDMNCSQNSFATKFLLQVFCDELLHKKCRKWCTCSIQLLLKMIVSCRLRGLTSFFLIGLQLYRNISVIIQQFTLNKNKITSDIAMNCMSLLLLNAVERSLRGNKEVQATLKKRKPQNRCLIGEGVD